MHRKPLTLLLASLVGCLIASSDLQAQVANVAYEGFYNIRTNGNDTTYGQALTHRYVNGELRFLTIAHPGVLHEFRIAGTALGGTVTQTTGTWNLTPTGGLNDFNGIWYEQAKNRLWLTSAQDYTATNHPAKVTLIALGANGNVSVVKQFFLNVPAKRVYGGCAAVPASLVAQLGGPYVCGWGGYTSLVNNGGNASIGPTMYALPDPDTIAGGATVSVRTVLDAAPSNQYRGVRKTIPINYFDGGDPRANPPTRPTSPPVSSAQWLSPNSDGLGWMVWGDSYYNTGVWIGTTYAAVASLCQGACWYQSATLAFDGRQFELHQWNGAALGSNVVARPASMVELNLPRGNTTVWSGNVTTGNIAGATYDEVSGRLYMIGFPLGPDVFTGRLYSFIVNGGGTGTPPPAGDSVSPSVNVTGPTGGSTVSGTVTLSATASDNVGVAGVWFTVDGNTVGNEDTSAPYQISWNTAGASNGSHQIRALARDAAGNTTTSSPVSVTVSNASADTTAPTVSLSAPASGATVSGTVTVSASASDNVGVTSVQFTLNGVNLGSPDTSAPYSISWNTSGAANATHALRAVAVDAAGNTTTSAARSVTVNNVSADTTAPTVSLSAPSSGATVSGTVTVSANASDAVGVTSVQFTLDGVDLGTADTTAPYSISWNTRSSSNGTHTLRAVARDAAGNTRTSSSRTVTVNNVTADTTAPTVGLSAPASGATISGVVSVSATASDNIGVASVQFTLNGVNLGAPDTSAPYSISWSTTGAANGTYILRAIARDAAGNATTSAARTVTVNNVISSGGSGTSTPSAPTVPASTCTTPDPFAAMGGGTCRNGGWLPPGMALPPQASVVPPPPASAPSVPPPPAATPSSVCTSIRPGSDWVCVNGGWLPPGLAALFGNISAPPSAPPSVPSQPSSPAGCTTPAPGSGWVCRNGGWLPPNHPALSN